MHLLICAALLVIVQGQIIDEDNCEDTVVINGQLFEKEVLKRNLTKPYQLAIDYDTNILFFSHGVKNETDAFTSAFLNLKTNEYQRIEGISEGFAHAVDSKNHIVYMGGEDGIYTFNFHTKEAEFYVDSHASVWQMFFKDKLYYTKLDYTSLTEHAYFLDKGVSNEVSELKSTNVKVIGIDAKENIIFANDTGIFWFPRDNDSTNANKIENDKIKKLSGHVANGMTSDLNGNVVFSTLSGIFTIDSNGDIHTLAKFKDVYGVAIDVDSSIIYSTRDSIVRLKRTNKTCTMACTKELVLVAKPNIINMY